MFISVPNPVNRTWPIAGARTLVESEGSTALEAGNARGQLKFGAMRTKVRLSQDEALIVPHLASVDTQVNSPGSSGPGGGDGFLMVTSTSRWGTS